MGYVLPGIGVPLYFANENCQICVEFILSFEQMMSLVYSKRAQHDLTFETDQKIVENCEK